MGKKAVVDKKIQRQTLKKVLPYIKPYRGLVILTILLALFSVMFALYLPILTGDAVDIITDYIGGGADTAAARDVTTVGMLVLFGGSTPWERLTGILLTMILIILLSAVTQWIMSLCNNRIVFSVTQDIRRRAFKNIQQLPLSFLDGNSSGDMVSRMIADVDQFADGLLIGFTQLFTGVITILGTLVFMFVENYIIALVVVLVTPLSLFAASFIAKKTYNMFREQSAVRGEQTALVNEMITNQRVVKSFCREEKVTEQFDEINKRLQKCSLRATFFSSLVNPSTRFVNNLVYAGVALSGGISAINGSITIGQLTCFLSYANQYTKPFNEISGVVTELQNALACADRIFMIIEVEPQEPDMAVTACAADSVDSGGSVDSVENGTGNNASGTSAKVNSGSGDSRLRGEVELDNVAFSYVPDRPLIEDLNLRVEPGQKIAIVGPTGCGKTTLINLLMRFYEVDRGEIRVDGTPVRSMTRKKLRTSYGMVLQDTWLKNGTIRDNIIIGKPDASEEEIIAAAKASHAHGFIRRLPKGYDTVISEDGGSLSGGQKQLLCITRVMLSVPEMLILDEATSSIDIRTELKIRQAFDTLMQGRTSFVVAHRLSTIRNADVILVMKDGHVVEQGNHETLLQKNGFYADLYNSQYC